jgi:hypothetical protein
VAACLYYTHLSADVTLDGQGSRYRHDVGLTLAVPLAEGLSLGVTNRYISYSENLPDLSMVDQSHSGFLLDAGLSYRVAPSLALALVGYNLVGNDDGLYTRALGFGLAWNASANLLFAADGRYDLDKSHGRYGGGAEYLFSGADGQQGVPVRAGYVYDSAASASYLTAGLGFVTPRVGIDLGGRRQVTQGDELMLQLSLRVFLPN